jgi:hypothetical protein
VIIPSDPVLRQAFYDELIDQCLASRNNRFAFYSMLRNYFLFGGQDPAGAPYNKIGSTIDTMASFLYSPDAVRFSIYCGATSVEDDIHKSVPLAREVTDQWRMSRTHLNFGMGLKWSLVFGSMLMKVQWSERSKTIRSYLLEPHQFGVLREDIPDLSDQEAFCMCYTITKTELYGKLEGNPRREQIMKRVARAGSTESARPFAEGLNRLIIGGPVDGVSGSVALQGGSSSIEGGVAGRGTVQYSYQPSVQAELVDMVDLYVFDDETKDYQLASIASPDVTIFDRPQKRVGVAGRPHFVVIRPENNLYDYFWGESYVARLAWLQDWRTERVMQIRKLMALQVDPPAVGTGMGGIADEKFLAFYTPGGRLSAPTSMSKVSIEKPDVPETLFKDLDQIDSMFDDVAGLGHILQGKGESGVRSRGQADLMARLGSSRPKARAAVVEEQAEDVASLMLCNIQESSAQRFQVMLPGAKEPLTFIAEQFTKDYEVKVDAHSSSPIFVEDRKKDADELFKAHAINRAALLRAYDPPHVQELLEELKEIEAKEEKDKQLAAMAGQPHPDAHSKGRK